MVLLIIIPIFYGYFIGNIAYFQTNPDCSKSSGLRSDIYSDMLFDTLSDIVSGCFWQKFRQFIGLTL